MAKENACKPVTEVIHQRNQFAAEAPRSPAFSMEAEELDLEILQNEK